MYGNIGVMQISPKSVLVALSLWQKIKTKRIMKRHICILSALSQALFVAAQITVVTPTDYISGDSIDIVRFDVGYDFAFITVNTEERQKPANEQMTLEVGNRTTSFYSQVVAQSDSMAAELTRKGVSQISYSGEIPWRVYCDYPSEGTYTYLERKGLDRFLMSEQMPEAVWTLCPDSTSAVLGYPCHKAKATFMGREWTVWYTEDIPTDKGPWLLRGLPGLILRAYTTDSIFSFEANSLAKGDGRRPMYYKGGKYEDIGRKAMKNVYERYYADPVGYITNRPNVKVTVTDGNGNAIATPKKLKYNLLDKTMQAE